MPVDVIATAQPDGGRKMEGQSKTTWHIREINEEIKKNRY